LRPSLRASAVHPLTIIAIPLFVGCTTPNAILEVELVLPPSTATGLDRDYAFVQFRSGEVGFDQSWTTDPRGDYPGTELTDSTQEARYSVVSEDDTIRLHLKVRFCSGPTSDAATCKLMDEEGSEFSRARWFEFERPFYIGERTKWKVHIEQIPSDRATVETVERCHIEGCADGDGSDYCRLDRSHFCE